MHCPMREHITVDGDTFDMLALKYYYEEKKSGKIIAANPDHCDTLIFEAGVVLTIPDDDAVTAPQTLPPWRR